MFFLDLRVVKSSLHTKTTNSKSHNRTYVITGEELERRIAHENFNATLASNYLCLSHGSDKTGLGHSSANLNRLLTALQGKSGEKKSPFISAFTNLPEG